jgi:hypothetical protein
MRLMILLLRSITEPSLPANGISIPKKTQSELKKEQLLEKQSKTEALSSLTNFMQNFVGLPPDEPEEHQMHSDYRTKTSSDKKADKADIAANTSRSRDRCCEEVGDADRRITQALNSIPRGSAFGNAGHHGPRTTVSVPVDLDSPPSELAQPPSADSGPGRSTVATRIALQPTPPPSRPVRMGGGEHLRGGSDFKSDRGQGWLRFLT